jgi:hypothetical protein
MPKYVVICGPELSEADAFYAYDEVNRMGNGKHILEVFPESNMGADGCRNLVRKYVEGDYEDIPIMVFITRYDMIPNELGCLISEGKISHEDVSILLDRGSEWDKFSFTPDGVIESGWPFGILS